MKQLQLPLAQHHGQTINDLFEIVQARIPDETTIADRARQKRNQHQPGKPKEKKNQCQQART